MDECEECRKREVFRIYNNKKLCIICYSAEYKADRNLGGWKNVSKNPIVF